MFIAFEGVDGTGKSTQLDQCRDWLKALGYEVLVCRDPGSTSLGLRLREILLNRSELKIDMEAEMFLFMAARSQMVAELIKPALECGKVVLCDRFLLSTVVYQGHAGQLSPEIIWQIGEVATQGYSPNLTLVFDVPLEIAMQRLGESRDRMESRGESFFTAVRQGFLSEVNRKDDLVLVDAQGSVSEIQQKVQAAVRSMIDLTPNKHES